MKIVTMSGFQLSRSCTSLQLVQAGVPMICASSELDKFSCTLLDILQWPFLHYLASPQVAFTSEIKLKLQKWLVRLALKMREYLRIL